MVEVDVNFVFARVCYVCSGMKSPLLRKFTQEIWLDQGGTVAPVYLNWIFDMGAFM